MHYFRYKGKDFFCENVKVKDLAEEYGTPLYIYSARTIVEHFRKLKKAFSELSPLICYSVKANSNLSVLKMLIDNGAGLDIVSGGELYRAKISGCTPGRIVYASVGKTEAEILAAVKYGILMFNVESTAELRRIDSLGRKLKKVIKVALRINPDIEPKTHKYITTGKKETKFGMDMDTIRGIISDKDIYPYLNIAAFHIHIGSQIIDPSPFVKAIEKVFPLIDEAGKAGIKLEYFNIGGGLGIVYNKETPQSAEDFAGRVTPLLKKTGLKLILEPGRFIAGNAGILVTKVLYVKESPFKRFIIVDGAMNDLLRPSLYGAYHEIVPLNKPGGNSKPVPPSDIVGPVCESGDFLGKDQCVPADEGDYLAALGCGAYGFSMSSNYNSRPRAAEVIVKNNNSFLIRKRETYRDLISKERIVDVT